jgi:hypothetical protein
MNIWQRHDEVLRTGIITSYFNLRFKSPEEV